jgi:heme/copper-type cytochrome/quinol oxidase subunit 2
VRSSTRDPQFEYQIARAQLCGLGHYRMRGYVHIETPEAFANEMDEREALLTESGDSVWQ